MFPNDELTLEAERGRNPLYKHVAKTYLWMFFGLAITFAVGMTLYASNLVFFFYAVPMLSLVLLVAQLGLVIFLSARLTKISVNACRAVFVIYSALTGITIGAVLAAYGAGVAMLAFGVSAFFFGCMAAAGLITRRDVSGFRSLVIFGLLALIVMQVINLFLPKEKKLNPMIGACGISAFPMSARVVYKMAIKEDPQNYLLMQCVGVNVSGQVASVIAGGLLLNLLV